MTDQMPTSTTAGRSDAVSKARKYETLLQQIDTMLARETDPIVWMATAACLIHEAFDFLWTGFYRVRGTMLTVGPYQGSLGCFRISFDHGVCGACAREKKTQIVVDVHAFAGHIACDSRSRSEIVVPVFDEGGDLRAVLDIDSAEPGAFDEVDREALEQLVSWMEKIEWNEPH